MLETDYLLLGERHDNLVHHEHQTWFIRQLSQNQVQASVAFEMIDNYQGGRLARQTITSADQMIKVLNQFKTSWKYETRYKDLFAEVIKAGYRIDAANMNRKRLMHMVMQGEDSIPPEYKQILQKTPLTDAQAASLQEEIKQSHCNMLDDKTSKKMVMGQRVRDAIIAQSLLKSDLPLKVLIAGAGHVRNDRGVPIYLQGQGKIMTVGFTEVADGRNDARLYTERWDTDEIPFDIVWFTPQVKRGDLCAQLKKHMKKQSVKQKQ
jgi:uncharacterized iron-regulated protein